MLDLSEPHLLRKTTWNLPGFIIILLLWIQLTAVSNYDPKLRVILLVYLQNWLKCYHPQNYELRIFEWKRESRSKKFCIKLVWKLSLGMHLTELCQTRFIHYFFEHFVYGILNKNRFSKVNHYLGHMLRDLRSISRLVYSQKVSLPFLKHSYQHKLNTVWLSIYC